MPLVSVQENLVQPARFVGWYWWRGELAGKGCRRVNMVQILCTHLCKLKNDAYSNYSRYRVRNKGECSGGEFRYDVFDIL
jgi:hypothetical protein